MFLTCLFPHIIISFLGTGANGNRSLIGNYLVGSVSGLVFQCLADSAIVVLVTDHPLFLKNC